MTGRSGSDQADGEVGPVRVALWGLGGHALRKVLPGLVECKQTALHGIATRNVQIGGQTARQYGCIAWDTPDAMLADPEVDAVYVATPTGVHHEQGLRVLDAGKHLWCEKSLTDNLERSLSLLSLARQKDLALCESFMYRHHPQFERVVQLVSSPEFGPIASLTSRFGIPHQDRGGFRYSRELGGGALLDLGCYPINLALHLLGRLEVATCGVGWQPGAGGPEVDIDGYAVLTSPSGARAHIEWGYGLAYRNEVFVWGANQSLHTDRIFSKPPDFAPAIVIADAHGNSRREAIATAESFVRMFEAFARTVRNTEARRREWASAEAQARQVAAVAAFTRPLDVPS